MARRLKSAKDSYRERASEKLWYSKHVGDQIERINASPNIQVFIWNVENLEILLMPFLKGDFEKRLDMIEKEFKIDKDNGMDRHNNIDYQVEQRLLYIRAKNKYRLLMELINEVGMIPERQIVWDEEVIIVDDKDKKK